MGGDKASQERLQARADAAELERQALRKEAASQKEVILFSNPTHTVHHFGLIPTLLH